MKSTSLHDPSLNTIFAQDREILKKTQLPIVTVSGTFSEDLKKWGGLPNEELTNDIVFSRAHFSMAYGLVRSIWGDQINNNKAWLVDPTNFVSSDRWRNIALTEDIGKLIARTPILKTVKDFIDRFGRKKLPILDSITPPLLYLFEDVHQPILSFHIAAGNILAKLGKIVIQVITDPHVREDYLENAALPNMYFCVFDEETKFEALEKAFLSGIDLDPDRVIVTGPPVDPRVVEIRKNKTYDPKAALKILMTTGGIGTNKQEIQQLLHQLLSTAHQKNRPFEIMLYAGTQDDFVKMAQYVAGEHRIKVQMISDLNTKRQENARQLTLLYHPQIFDANEILIKHGFPFADCIITKPSGDMAYDAVAAGCFLLTLRPWGVWEERLEDIFWQKGLARKAETKQIIEQFAALKEIGWIDSAIEAVRDLDPLFLNGTKEIIKAAKSVHR
jgi:hypothetical protein